MPGKLSIITDDEPRCKCPCGCNGSEDAFVLLDNGLCTNCFHNVSHEIAPIGIGLDRKLLQEQLEKFTEWLKAVNGGCQNCNNTGKIWGQEYPYDSSDCPECLDPKRKCPECKKEYKSSEHMFPYLTKECWNCVIPKLQQRG